MLPRQPDFRIAWGCPSRCELRTTSEAVTTVNQQLPTHQRLGNKGIPVRLFLARPIMSPDEWQSGLSRSWGTLLTLANSSRLQPTHLHGYRVSFWQRCITPMHPSAWGSFILIKMMSKKLHGLEESCLSSQYVDLTNLTMQPHYFLKVSMLKLILSTKTWSRTYMRRAWCEHDLLIISTLLRSFLGQDLWCQCPGKHAPRIPWWNWDSWTDMKVRSAISVS